MIAFVLKFVTKVLKTSALSVSVELAQACGKGCLQLWNLRNHLKCKPDAIDGYILRSFQILFEIKAVTGLSDHELSF